MCFMARSKGMTCIFYKVDTNDKDLLKNTSFEYEWLFLDERIMNKDSIYTITNLRSEINDLNYEIKDFICVDLDAMSIELKSKHSDLKKAILAGVVGINALENDIKSKIDAYE